MKYGDTWTSKASPIKWLRYFLSQYSPGKNCKNKYVHMDQGRELYNNPELQNLFISKGYRIRPTVVLKPPSKTHLLSALIGPSLIIFEPSLLAQTLLSSSGPMSSTMFWNYSMPSLKQAKKNLPSNWQTPTVNLRTYPNSGHLAVKLGWNRQVYRMLT